MNALSGDGFRDDVKNRHGARSAAHNYCGSPGTTDIHAR